MSSKTASALSAVCSAINQVGSRSISSYAARQLTNPCMPWASASCIGRSCALGLQAQQRAPFAAQRNFSSAFNAGKGVRDDSIGDRKAGNDEVPVQSGSSAPQSAEDGASRRARRDWISDEFDSMFAPFRSFVPRPLRHSLKQMQRWMNRDGRMQSGDAEDQLSTSVRDMIYDFDAELLKPVSLTLEERDNDYVAKMYLKGFQKSDLNVRMQDDYLIVSGSLTNDEFKDRKDRGKMRSYSSQSFSRVLNLPEDVDRNKIHAKFDNNELLIELPKDSSKKHVIEIH